MVDGQAIVAGVGLSQVDAAGGLVPWEVFLYSSGATGPWQQHSTALTGSVRNDSHIALAARPGGELLLIDIQVVGFRGSAATFDPVAATWGQLDDDFVEDEIFLGEDVLGVPFSVVRSNPGYAVLFVDKNTIIHASSAAAAAGLWQDANFPTNAVPGPTALLGVAGATSPAGNTHLAVAGAGSTIRTIWGNGAQAWNEEASISSPDTFFGPPSVARWQSGTWLVAYRTTDERVAVVAIDPAADEIVESFPLSHPLNTLVSGRPQIAANGTNIVVAWKRADSQLIVVRGSSENLQ